jgi:hypothetical protein
MTHDHQPMSVMSNNKKTNQATDYLDRLLHEAVEAGADTVELERVPEGLEICFLAGGSGLGKVLKDRTLEARLIELIVRRAGLKNQVKSKMNWNISGKTCSITVEEYDSFGESCFRLKLP